MNPVEFTQITQNNSIYPIFLLKSHLNSCVPVIFNNIIKYLCTNALMSFLKLNQIYLSKNLQFLL